MKTATIIGAGLVGSLWAIYLSKSGYKVDIFESRDDLRKTKITAGKSINLALSTRGLKALETVGLSEEIKNIAIPMYGRTMHSIDGNLMYQSYGQEGQAIYSVSRAEMNCKMMSVAEKNRDTNIHYNEKCYDVDLDNGIVYIENTLTKEKTEHKSDVVFGADGTFSTVRVNGMQKKTEFKHSQTFIEDGYRELLLPANEDGSYKLDKNSLHIWPRGEFMLIALANEDGSFTCTLFMPHKNHDHSFEKLVTKEDINNFFESTFPDFYKIMPSVCDVWGKHPLASLSIIKCYPWHHGKTVLMGDSAHATVPFYGQGMNAGLEDCTVMWELMQKHKEEWEKVFEEFSVTRKPDGDALQELSMYNYNVMRKFVGSSNFLLQKKFEQRIEKLYPNKYLALYSQVSFSNIRYAEALKKGKEQDKFIKEVMSTNDISALFDSNKIDDLIHQIMHNYE